MINIGKRQNGITLIALVVTIIVLLILAGIALNTIAGNNGILTKATEAKKANQETIDKEEIKTIIMARQIEQYSQNGSTDKESILEGIDGLQHKQGDIYTYNDKDYVISNNFEVYQDLNYVTDAKVGDVIIYHILSGQHHTYTTDRDSVTGEYNNKTGILDDQDFATKDEDIKCVVLENSEESGVRIIPVNCQQNIMFGGFYGYFCETSVLSKISNLYYNSKYSINSKPLGYDDYAKDADLIKELYNKGFHNIMGNHLYTWLGSSTYNAVTRGDAECWEMGGNAVWLASTLIDGSKYQARYIDSSDLTVKTRNLYFDNTGNGNFYELGVVPVITLKSNLYIAGEGTMENPYKLLESE